MWGKMQSQASGWDRASLRQALLILADIEKVLAQDNAILDDHLPLDQGGHCQEPLVLLVGAEAHHSLDPGAVVPGAVEEDHLAGRGQMLDVALKVPLGALALGRRRRARLTGWCP